MPADPEFQSDNSPAPPTVLCKNCGTPAPLNYCPNCGQNKRNLHSSLKHLLAEFLGDYFTFDSRLIRSLIPLMFKPGQLTRDYISGQRQRYIPPLRLYVFCSVTFFLLLSLSRNTIPVNVDTGVSAKGEDSNSEPSAVLVEENVAQPIVVSADDNDENQDFFDPESFLGKRYNNTLRQQVQHIQSIPNDELSEKLTSEMVRLLPKSILVLVPVIALILKLLYYRRRIWIIDHLIFALHYNAFIYAIFSLVILLRWIPQTPLVVDQVTTKTMVLAVVPLYIFLAMKRVYAQNYLRTAVKFLALNTLYFFCLVIVIIGSILAGLLTV